MGCKNTIFINITRTCLMCNNNPFLIKKWSYYPIQTCFTFF